MYWRVWNLHDSCVSENRLSVWIGPNLQQQRESLRSLHTMLICIQGIPSHAWNDARSLRAVCLRGGSKTPFPMGHPYPPKPWPSPILACSLAFRASSQATHAAMHLSRCNKLLLLHPRERERMERAQHKMTTKNNRMEVQVRPSAAISLGRRTYSPAGEEACFLPVPHG